MRSACLPDGFQIATFEARIGIAFGYVLGWLRQEENQYLAVPPEIAKELPIELQRLSQEGHLVGKAPDELVHLRRDRLRSELLKGLDQ